MSHFTTSMNTLQTKDRYRFLMILHAADQCEEYQFGKQSCNLWLANFPGDLYVQYYQALNIAYLDRLDQATSQFEGLIEQDPMFIEPYRALNKFSSSSHKKSLYQDLTHYLTRKNPPDQQPENWLSPLWEARTAYSNGNFDKSTALIHQSLIKQPPSPIPAILHLKTAYKKDNLEMLTNLSEIYYQQWPKCLQINIIKALAEMDQGQETAAVERLQWVASQDSAGQVIQRLMGNKHRFANLWPDRMEVYFDLPIPASISTYLGWNQLQSGQIHKPEFKQTPVSNAQTKESSMQATQKIQIADHSPIKKNIIENAKPEDDNSQFTENEWATEEDFQEIQKAFSKLAKRFKKPDLERSDNRFPVYVILSSKKSLEKEYGPNTASIIDDLLINLSGLIQNLPDWDSILFYPDDPTKTSPLGLKPTMANDAHQFKLSLADLDQSLAKRGEMVGAVLIVGGPEIVPYHHLPNPTQDNDLDVPSDNPYATIDENYFIPQWPVGRLPGETGSDAGLLLNQIRNLIHQYEMRLIKSKSGSFTITSLINWVHQLFSNLGRTIGNNHNMGYSAEIWQDASANVYKPIGKIKDLILSPPTNARTLILNNGLANSLGYFNLHGVKDGPHWYGQKNFFSETNGPDYPIALSPAMYNEHAPSPKLILTEACFGANVHKKQLDKAISLKCLDTGTTSFIGSTCIAYGSITPPLIAADYLAEKFWSQVLQGLPTGYALMQAKLSLAEEMIRMQGFLDGEDQKTILSFVLFGDPLAVHDHLQAMPKPIFRFKTHPAVHTISDSDMEPTNDSKQMPRNVNKQVKNMVEQYLPGLQNAELHYNKTSSINHQKTLNSKNPDRYLVTIQKSFEQNQHTKHHHFARMTFDTKGKLVKFTTSR